MKHLIAGLVIFFVGMFGGSYIAHIIPNGHWVLFPTLFTIGLICVGAVVLFSWGFSEVLSKSV